MGDETREMPDELESAIVDVAAVYLRAARERMPAWTDDLPLSTSYALLAGQVADTLREALDHEEIDQGRDVLRGYAVDVAATALRLLVRANRPRKEPPP